MTKRPENPALVAMNKANREFWEKNSREISDFIEKKPEAILLAQNDVKDEEVLLISVGADPRRARAAEHHMRKAIEAEKTAQSRRASKSRKKKDTPPDSIDQILMRGIKGNLTAKDIWKQLVDEALSANEHGDLRVSNDRVSVFRVVDDLDKIGGERVIRNISETSLAATISRLRKKINS